MARKKKHEEHEGHANHERWVLSYADILTLLLALFIVMFAISKVDQKKFEEFKRGTAESFGQANLAMQGQSGNLSGEDGILPDQRPGQEQNTPSDQSSADAVMANQKALQEQRAREAAAAAEKANLEKVKHDLAKQLKAAGLDKSVQFQLDERGLVVNIVTDKVLFPTGKADLQPGGAKVLDAIAPLIKKLPNTMVVEGHTDNVPISGSFPSNWELSGYRAGVVLRRLVADGVSPKRISASGYADQRPLANNGTEAGRARNRRVAVVILPTVALSGPAVGTSTTAPGKTRGATPSSSPSPSAIPSPSPSAIPTGGATPAPGSTRATTTPTPGPGATTITGLDAPPGAVVTPGG